MSYQPYVGKLEDGTEVLVTIQKWHDDDGNGNASAGERVEVAFRTPQYRTWGPPVTCERAP